MSRKPAPTAAPRGLGVTAAEWRGVPGGVILWAVLRSNILLVS